MSTTSSSLRSNTSGASATHNALASQRSGSTVTFMRPVDHHVLLRTTKVSLNACHRLNMWQTSPIGRPLRSPPRCQGQVGVTEMNNAVIVDVVRLASGKGKAGGTLWGCHPVDLLGRVLSEVVARNDLDPARIDDVIAGCVEQVGEQSFNIARSAALAAGFPESVPATTVDRQCGSSQQAVHFAAQGVMAGAYDVVIACGVESMSRVPMGTASSGADTFGPSVAARYPQGLVKQGVAAELVAARWKLDQDALDAFAVMSHQRAAAAVADGCFANEIVAMPVVDADGRPGTHTVDETIRAGTTAQALSGLKPSFASAEAAERFPTLDWRVTPGNSSPLTDGGSGGPHMA